MLQSIYKYCAVGIVNTAIHWIVFAALFYAGSDQAWANFTAFCVAVTFSFFANAKWTFNSEATKLRYVCYVFFMGALALAFGWLADKQHLEPLITLITFSIISLFCGFAYSKYIIFRERR